VAFSTHEGNPGQTGETFRKWIESRGMNLVGVANIHQNDIRYEEKTKEIVSLITSVK
jgi:hypothetical protein